MTRISAALVVAICCILSPPAWGVEYSQADLQEIARQFAPIIYQEVDRGTQDHGHDARGREDFIAPVDYDGDLDGSNNWDNIQKHALHGAVYFSLVETRTHYFITYSIYHPRDWNRIKLPLLLKMYSEHENDMENLQVVVEKRRDDPRIQILLTQAHSNSDFAIGKGCQVKSLGDVRTSKHPLILMSDEGRVDSGGTHPGVFVERKGHGIYSLGDRKKVRFEADQGKIVSLKKRTDFLPVWRKHDVVQYVPFLEGVRAPNLAPGSGKDQRLEYGVPYELVSIYHKFWTRFEAGAPYEKGQDWNLSGEGALFAKPFRYQDPLFDLERVPRHFRSDKVSGPGKIHAGITPFSMGVCVWRAKCQTGRLFFNPAWGYGLMFDFPGSYDWDYTYNPYRESVLNRRNQGVLPSPL